jgi:hypothetical protein
VDASFGEQDRKDQAEAQLSSRLDKKTQGGSQSRQKGTRHFRQRLSKARGGSFEEGECP